MELPQEAMLLRIFVGERDRAGGRPVHEAIVERARAQRLAGATVLRGPMGFGRSAHVHRAALLELSEDLPIVIEIVDAEAKIQAFLPELERLMVKGLVTVQRVTVIRYGDQAPTG
ncbi:MAG: DUF190 domain-containing protein [Geminicoccaceae bacterium]